MRYVWETTDIKSGRRVGAANGAAEQWIIGYDPGADGPNRYTLTSLSDGMLAHRGMTNDEMATVLTRSASVPLDL